MKREWATNFLLFVIAVALVAIAVRPYVSPEPAAAQVVSGRSFYVEPGVQVLHAPDGSKQLYGKVITDLRTGQIWGFPTMTLDPYPTNAVDSKPQVSHPFLLGRFALEDVEK
jgi:hypothetical protein